jgi:magnesium-transporting ATPase (P-type)
VRRAGIVTWLLTGDKRATAVNIGYSSGLLKVNNTFNTTTQPAWLC